MKPLDDKLQEIEKYGIRFTQLCKLLNVHAKTVREWRMKLNFPGPVWRNGNGLVFDRRDVNKWLEKRGAIRGK